MLNRGLRKSSELLQTCISRNGQSERISAARFPVGAKSLLHSLTPRPRMPTRNNALLSGDALTRGSRPPVQSPFPSDKLIAFQTGFMDVFPFPVQDRFTFPMQANQFWRRFMKYPTRMLLIVVTMMPLGAGQMTMMRSFELQRGREFPSQFFAPIIVGTAAPRRGESSSREIRSRRASRWGWRLAACICAR